LRSACAAISACGSDTLLQAHAPVYDKYLRDQMIAGVYRGAIAQQEHQTLLECALRRDATTACAVVKVHIEACVDVTLANGVYGFSAGS
jgi:DNA-binding GntR family transcriptional regulator